MKIIDALSLSHSGTSRDGEPYSLFLACSFSPLHLGTFVTAHVAQALPARRIALSNGIFGDLIHNLRMAADEKAQNLIVALEWFDFDPRLSIRSLGGWTDAESIFNAAELAFQRLRDSLAVLDQTEIVVSLPSLPLPPLFMTKSFFLGAAESRLRALLADFTSWAATRTRMHVVHSDALSEASPITQRWDIETDLGTGFPYTVRHADVLAQSFVSALLPPTRRKGIITDLDDTLWQGIVGDSGPENVAWSLEHDAQVHGLYQQTLATLAGTGVLVGVASKNDPDLVRAVLERKDLVVPKDLLFPVDVHWGSKSQSVARILRAWNVGASSVVFIDDSPMEIAEVQVAFPEIECRQFSKDDPVAVMALLRWLRDEFASESPSEEDKLRRKSLEQNAVFVSEARLTDNEAFLQSLRATVSIRAADRTAPRAFELVNKTNQFNINGARYTRDQWQACGDRQDDFVLMVAYQDRFGPLGTIAIMAGRVSEQFVSLEDWVISCRAFARRVEYRCMAFLFSRFNKDSVCITFRPTARNGPAQDLLKTFFSVLSSNGSAQLVLNRCDFEKTCPSLYDRVENAD